jgi:predicted DNA-binding transcriptional regulator YafY
MRRAERLFEIIQILRQANGAVTAADLAEKLEITTRTVYRDIAALQARQTPIEGAAGIGYILRKSYDLPPLNFDTEEIEAIVVGLSMLSRTGDAALQNAATRVAHKIEAIDDAADRLHVSPYGVCGHLGHFLAPLRQAVRAAQAIEITYLSLDDRQSTRTVKPIALAYFAEVNLLAAWCETRADYRHFRVDRIQSMTPLDQFFADERKELLKVWNDSEPFKDHWV